MRDEMMELDYGTVCSVHHAFRDTGRTENTGQITMCLYII